MKQTNKKVIQNRKELLKMIAAIAFLLVFLGGIIWFTTRPEPPKTKMTGCGWGKDNGEDVWICREYRQINYKLNI